ncbi:hypothetical protein BC830DRAFT_1128241 [Chytriomyces sp. MP71]|nr:hypothetical protein BC830DRAFT_1128241 [Chytriomyces sp. MP71]
MLSSSAATLERAAAKARTEQERHFARERNALREMERKAAVAVQSLERKQRTLEAKLQTVSAVREYGTKKGGKQRELAETPLPIPSKHSSQPKKKKKRAKEPVRIPHTEYTTSPGDSSQQSSNACHIPRYSLNHGHSSCTVSYVDIGLGEGFNHSFVDHEPIEPCQVGQREFRKEVIRFLRNLESEEGVTAAFLQQQVSDDDTSLPLNWKEQSVIFGAKLKDKIGDLMHLFNEYFSKMENLVTEDDAA